MMEIDIENRTSYDVFEQKEFYACVSNDLNEVEKSTSGGAFGEIAKYVLSRGGVVYGCAYQNHLEVRHVRVDKVQDLDLLRGSKYVQSNTGKTYKEAEEDLKNGRLVLYSGTPCQIAGLKAFLRKDYENLISVDLICHGTPPQEYFSKFVEWYEKKNKVVLTNVSFRDKKNNGWSLAGCVYGIKNGKTFQKKLYYFDNWYYFHFLKGNIYRKACYDCRFANVQRPADFTLGDCWGESDLNLPFRAYKGCSLVLLNSLKAKEIFGQLNVTSLGVDEDFAIKNNRQLVAPTKKPKNYEELINRFNTLSGEELQKKFQKENKKGILIGKIKYAMPCWLKRLLKRIK